MTEGREAQLLGLVPQLSFPGSLRWAPKTPPTRRVLRLYVVLLDVGHASRSFGVPPPVATLLKQYAEKLPFSTSAPEGVVKKMALRARLKRLRKNTALLPRGLKPLIHSRAVIAALEALRHPNRGFSATAEAVIEKMTLADA